VVRRIAWTITGLLLLLMSGCYIAVSQTVLDFGSTETTKTFILEVQGPIEWEIYCTAGWVEISPDEGSTTSAISVTVDRAGLEPGSYTATLEIFTDAIIDTPTVELKMIVPGTTTTTGSTTTSGTVGSTTTTTTDRSAFTLSGRVTGSCSADVLIQLTGEAAYITYTDNSGLYEFLAVDGGESYTVIPSHTYCYFEPPNYVITNLSRDTRDLDFIAYGPFVTTTISSGGCPSDYPFDCGNGFCCPLSHPICGYGDDEGFCFSLDTTTIPGDCPLADVLDNDDTTLDTLRTFRDTILNQTPEGQEIIRLYYELSPVIVNAMEADEKFKADVKYLIDELLVFFESEGP